MLNVKVLGSGCANCKRLEATVRKVAEAQHLDAEIEKVTDYAYRAVHEMTLQSKAMMTAFYCKGPKISYWYQDCVHNCGLSDGGG